MGSIQISSMSWERSGKPGRFSFFPKGRTYSPPRRGGGISCGNRALSEGDCGVCGRRWTRLHFCQTASLVHAVGKGGHFESPYLWGGILPPHLAACLSQPATGSLTQIQGCNESIHPCWRYVAFHDVPVGIRCGRRATAFHSNPSERMVDNGNLSFRGQNGQPWSRTLCRGCCGLSELFSVAQ